MELAIMEKLTELACTRYLKRKEREGKLPETLQDMASRQAAIEKLKVIKQATEDIAWTERG